MSEEMKECFVSQRCDDCNQHETFVDLGPMPIPECRRDLDAEVKEDQQWEDDIARRERLAITWSGQVSAEIEATALIHNAGDEAQDNHGQCENRAGNSQAAVNCLPPARDEKRLCEKQQEEQGGRDSVSDHQRSWRPVPL